MRITKWGEYGILCCVYLASHPEGEAVGANEIAEAQQIPLQYTHQILQRLRKGNVITSVRGPHGGYRLSDSPHQITLRAILCAAEGDTFDVICETNPIYDQCKDPLSRCRLSIVWVSLKSAIDEVLEKHTLASLVTDSEGTSAGNPAMLAGDFRKDSSQKDSSINAENDLVQLHGRG